MLQFGVISSETKVKTTSTLQNDFKKGKQKGYKEMSSQILSRCVLPLDDPVSATSMPESGVRASMLIRLNSLASGVSGVKEATI
jgi:phenylalanine ammonia-lyase